MQMLLVVAFEIIKVDNRDKSQFRSIFGYDINQEVMMAGMTDMEVLVFVCETH